MISNIAGVQQRRFSWEWSAVRIFEHLAEIEKQKYIYFMLGGLLLIAAASIYNGFYETFITSLKHLKSDLTTELSIHIYIAGWIIVIYGIYKLLKNEKTKNS